MPKSCTVHKGLDTMDAFYTDLQQEMHRISNKDSITLTGDFNAKVLYSPQRA